MGASESSLLNSQSQRFGDEITTVVSQRSVDVDPILDKLNSLKTTTPILTAPLTESSLTDILVRKRSSSSSSSASTTVDPKVIQELFSTYREHQEEKTVQISKKQEDIENKIEVADALAVKLLQRLNYSVSAMKSTSQHLTEVYPLQVEIGELKGRLTEVISNVNALCKRIAAEVPEPVEPFSITSPELEDNSNTSSLQRLNINSDSAESKQQTGT
ncbi:hypothetical protein ACFE04_024199 [Oxalis oulophora]